LQHAAESSFSLNRKLNPKTGAWYMWDGSSPWYHGSWENWQ
jgi:hypothetical protein